MQTIRSAIARSRSRRVVGKGDDGVEVETALLLIDVINPLEFAEAEQLLETGREAAACIAKLRKAVGEWGIPAIYVNDNFGRWRSDFRAEYRYCSRPGSAGAEICRMLKPRADDFFVLKPKHSGFYCTALEVLLEELGVKRLILTGFAGNMCVLYTANDAYLRGFDLVIPADSLASNSRRLNNGAIAHMKRFLHATVYPSHEALVEDLPGAATGRGAGSRRH